MAYQRYLIYQDGESKQIIQEANAVKDRLKTALSYSQSATKTLAFIIERYGVPQDFDSVASTILKENKFIDALQLTRKGLITHVYPLKGNERAVGYDVLKDTAINREAFKAIERRELYFAGPFNLIQGRVAVVGRLPIFHGSEFWGFSVVLINFSTLLKAAGIEQPTKDYYYQISKINPATKKEEFFLPFSEDLDEERSFAVNVTQGEWKLYVIPKEKIIPGAVFISIIGLLFSVSSGFFTWYLMRQPEKLSRLVEEKASEVIKLKRSAIDTIERVSDAFVSLDNNWRYTYMNKKAGEVFNRNPDEMIGKHIWTEFPEGIGQPFYHAYHQAMREQKYVHLVEYYEPYDLWFENHVYPSPDGLSIYFRDITESKKAEKLLEASEKYYRTLIEKSTDAVVLLDKHSRIIYHSPSTENITGYSYDEIHNKSSFDFTDPEQRPYFDNLVQSIIDAPGSFVKKLFQFRHKTGKYICIEGTYTK